MVRLAFWWIFSGKRWYLSRYYLYPDFNGKSRKFRTIFQQLYTKLPDATFPRRTYECKMQTVTSMALTDVSFRCHCYYSTATRKNTWVLFTQKFPWFDSDFSGFQMWMLQQKKLSRPLRVQINHFQSRCLLKRLTVQQVRPPSSTALLSRPRPHISQIIR